MMNNSEKEAYLRSAQTHLVTTAEQIQKSSQDLERSITDLRVAVQKPSLDFVAQQKLLSLLEEQLEHLNELHASPYFNRCDIQFDQSGAPETFYISKFAFPEQQLISWVAPLARLRFETPGPCRYALPDGSKRGGTLLRKDQYMIVDKNILFFAMDRLDESRELIYQQHFTQHKIDFVLPEIVAQMEKAQDDVLRIPYKGSLLISGPAGSGKTTLALHRIAFLSQSPDTAPLFPHRRMIVFVQDQSSQDYFSHLLPTLGIHDVRITTFEAWAMDHLRLEHQTYQFRIGHNEEERDRYEYEKDRILTSSEHLEIAWLSDPIRLLDRIYRHHLPKPLHHLWEDQKRHHLIDRFDLTLLLLRQHNRDGALTTVRTSRVRQKNGTWKEKQVREGYQYTLMALDEIQNYLPLQVQLLKSCIHPSTQAMMYMGDLAQQTRIGSLKDWEEIHESFQQERAIVLQKGYRQTQQLMEYIQSRGYPVTIPPQPKQGPIVQEHLSSSLEEQTRIIHDLLSSVPTDRLIGILAFSPEELTPYSELTQRSPHVRCMTIHEAQGVEFDTVYLLEPRNLEQDDSTVTPPKLKEERNKIQRDLLYVALTRAMFELHVFKG